MPDETVIDGEVVALDAEGRPSFNTLQNYGSFGAPPHFFIFDLLALKSKDDMGEPLTKRRELIETRLIDRNQRLNEARDYAKTRVTPNSGRPMPAAA
jgi:bifunctional non-homologous end joining protein LigD